jgi:hypothetical protein
MAVNGKMYAPTTLIPTGKEHSLSFRKDAEFTAEQIWKVLEDRRREFI